MKMISKNISMIMKEVIANNNISSSPKGIAISNKVYDNGVIIKINESMATKNIDLFIKVPSTKDNLKKGDLIIQESEYLFVDHKQDGNIYAVSVDSGTMKTLIPQVDLFGNSTYTKVFSAIKLMGGYDLIKKFRPELLTLINGFWKNKDNLEEFLKDNSTMLIPVLMNSKFNPQDLLKNKFIKKNKKKLLIAGAILGVGYVNKDKLNVEMPNIKMDKKKLFIITSVIGLIVGGVVAHKKGWLEKLKTKIIKTTIFNKFENIKTQLKNKLK